MAKQQLLDLVKFRSNLYSRASVSDSEDCKFIIDQTRYYETMKRSTQMKNEKQISLKKELQLALLRSGCQKEDIPGYRDFHDEEYAEEAARLRDAWKEVEDGNDPGMRGLAVTVAGSHPQHARRSFVSSHSILRSLFYIYIVS